MISRYTPEDFAALWSARRKYLAWFEVEVAACAAMEHAGIIPEGTAAKLRPVADRLDPERIDEIELETRHDVIAFLTHVEHLAGETARWLHHGMTSSDVVDTALAILLVDATDRMIARIDALLAAFRVRVEEHRRTPMIGRSHGMHAEPTTLGVVLAGHYAEFVRCRQRLKTARAEIAFGKIAGAVGTYGYLTPAIEADALSRLGLSPEPVATQIIPRDRHAALVSAMAIAASSIERFATNVRHWQRTEVREAEEPLAKGQKGSSAMPHKRNPTLSENLCGLARVVRATVIPALEDVALWHERDISHSSVERILLPDATATLAFMLDRMKRLVEGLVVYPANLRINLDRTGGLWASEGVLLALVDRGLLRDHAYEMVQRNATRASAGEAPFRDLLEGDAEIGKHLSTETIRKQFDLDHALAHCDTIIDRALALPIDR